MTPLDGSLWLSTNEGWDLHEGALDCRTGEPVEDLADMNE